MPLYRLKPALVESVQWNGEPPLPRGVTVRKNDDGTTDHFCAGSHLRAFAWDWILWMPTEDCPEWCVPMSDQAFRERYEEAVP